MTYPAHAIARPARPETPRARIQRRLGLAPARRPIYRRVGGIRFAHVGPLTVSASVSRDWRVSMHTALHVLAFAVGAVCALPFS